MKHTLSTICLNVYKSGCQFVQFCSFLNIWNHLDIFCNNLVFTGSHLLISVESCQLTWIQFLQKKKQKKTVSIYSNEYSSSKTFCKDGNKQLTLENPHAFFVYFLLSIIRCEETSDLPKVNNYEVKIRSKSNLSKASISGKTVNLSFPNFSKITKILCPLLSTVTNNSLQGGFLLCLA